MTSAPYEPHGIVGAVELELELLGNRVRLSGGDRRLHAEVARLFAPFHPGAQRAATAPAATVDVDHPSAPDGGTALVRAVAGLNAAALAHADCFAVHAGVVARGGLAAAFPAPSGAGKTTLVAACLRESLGYVSDEALCVPWLEGHRILGYPKPLALSAFSCRLLGLAEPTDAAGERYLTADELGGTVAAGELRLAHVVLPRRGPGLAARLRPARRQQVAAELLTRSFTHFKRAERAFELAHELAAGCRVWELDYDDPLAAAALVGGLLPG